MPRIRFGPSKYALGVGRRVLSAAGSRPPSKLEKRCLQAQDERCGC
jgi:hypothetical protein